MADRVQAINFFNQAAGIPKPPPNNSNVQLQYQLFSSAVIADPTMGQAVYEHSNTNRDLGLNHAAIAGYRMMLEREPSDVPGDMTIDMMSRALVNMSHSLYTLGKFKEAEGQVLKAIELNDQLALAWCNLSLIESMDGRLMESLLHAKKAHELEPENPVIETALAFAYLWAKDYAKGLEHFEARFPYRLQHFLNYPYPKWRGEEDKTIYLVSEQGIGDALSFSRFVEKAAKRSKFIHIVVQKELVRLLSVAFQHIRNVSILGSPQPFLAADHWSTFMSLPFALGLTTEEIAAAPPIKIPQFTLNPQWKATDRKYHIGVAWSGSPGSDINHWRSFPVTQLLDLYKVPGVQLYSLQVNDQTKELHQAGCAVMIRDLSPFISDVCDTVAIMDQLDLVVTTESAPGHIAGHAGVDCIIPYSYCGRDWRASWDGKSPLWYPKHTFVKQGPDQQWQPVFDKVVEMVRERVEAKP